MARRPGKGTRGGSDPAAATHRVEPALRGDSHRVPRRECDAWRAGPARPRCRADPRGSATRRRALARQGAGGSVHARDSAAEPELTAKRDRLRRRPAETRRDRGVLAGVDRQADGRAVGGDPGRMKKRRRARTVRLLDIAHARSGDKGDTANVGLIARKPEFYPILAKQVTAARVARHFKGMITGSVERFELPNLHALNFLLHGALDGGGTISLKTDAQGKVFSTALLRMEIEVKR